MVLEYEKGTFVLYGIEKVQEYIKKQMKVVLYLHNRSFFLLILMVFNCLS